MCGETVHLLLCVVLIITRTRIDFIYGWKWAFQEQDKAQVRE